MSEPQNPNGASSSNPENDDDGEATYRLARESPLAPEGIVPPPPLHSPVIKRTVKTVKEQRPQRAKKVFRALNLSLFGCCALIFITSVCVMTLELTASRLIAKHVGSSLYTWTSVIGVVLAGITIGNWFGGWLADHFDRGRTLSWMYLIGSISCGGVLWLDRVAGTLERPDTLSWQQWILLMVASIFFLPAFAMGATSPLLASLALNRNAHTGTTVGNVYAWGAFGSIVGTFLTGFYLIDVWGTRSIVGMTAATLGILAVFVATSRTLFRTVVILGWLNLLGWIVLAAIGSGDAFAAAGNVVADVASFVQSEQATVDFRENCEMFGQNVGEKLRDLGVLLMLRGDTPNEYHDESNYSDIIVSDSFADGIPVRSLRLDKLIHSYYDPANPTALHYEYEQVYAGVTKKVAWATSNKTPSACFYGGGGFIFPRWFLKEFPDSRRIDVAELDPAVLDVAQKQLGLTDELSERIRTTIGDARNFVDDQLRENAGRESRGEQAVKYDFIYGDAFNDFSIPFHLTTREFLQKTHDLLSEKGVFQANIIDIYPRTEYPVESIGHAFVEYSGPLPYGILGREPRENKAIPVVSYYAPLEIAEMGPFKFQLRVSKAIKPTQAKRLKEVTWKKLNNQSDPNTASTIASPAEKQGWIKAVEQLTTLSNRKLTLSRPLPDGIKPSREGVNRWVEAANPFEFVELYRTDNVNFVLGLRGAVSAEEERRLIELAPTDSDWKSVVFGAAERSRRNTAGRFLGRYVATAAEVFPNVYLFNTAQGQPDIHRDTFVMVCSRQPLKIGFLDDTEDWYGGPFAAIETSDDGTKRVTSGHMSTVIGLAGGMILTDDFAPVDNLLAPVVSTQE